MQDWLLGRWRLMRADASLDFAPGVRMEFMEAGELLYHIDVGGRDQVIALRYRVEGNTLYTEHTTSLHTTSVRFEHGVGDVLKLDFAGAQAWLVREGNPVALLDEE